MTKRSKTLVIIIATFLIVDVVVFAMLFLRKGEDARTKIITEKQDEKKVAGHIESDIIQGKITKIDGDEIEYLEYQNSKI